MSTPQILRHLGLAFLVLFSSLGAATPNRASWISSAILYGIAPWYQSPRAGHRFQDITRRLPELSDLGVNALWLQPIYPNHSGGQGYDVTDDFGVWPELGTEADLHALVGAAHSYGMKVLFDFVPNHASVFHPYAQDVVRKGAGSRYFDFFMHERDTAPYAEDYHELRLGLGTFIYYFWRDLVNWNFRNPETRAYLTGAAKHWV